jgi:REP-associated tyrosine transposase
MPLRAAATAFRRKVALARIDSAAVASICSWLRPPVGQGKLRERVRDIIRQVCREMGVHIIEGVLSSDHIHMFVSVPPHVAISDLMQRAKGRSSYKIQMEFPEIRKRYWGRRFWARGYFCTTSGNVTDDIILQYIQSHSDKPTDASR